MIRLASLAALVALTACASPASRPSVLPAAAAVATRSTADSAELARWRSRAARVTITRDDWGIAHVHGASDADAVFGMMYAEAEDDFRRVETNYLTALGRLSEAEGEGAIWQDLRARLYADPDTLRARYEASPRWLVALMDAWADGLNYYLATHPSVRPRVIRRFEPWMTLAFTEGSIGGDIEAISLRELATFYGRRHTGALPASPRDTTAWRVAVQRDEDDDPMRERPGSNGFAIAPSISANGHALLWINPHTTFYFRAELQVTSDSGLNAYGAATWGQFFIYQGFNDRVAWMHPTSTADVVDEYAEAVAQRDGGWRYRYGTEERPVVAQPVTLAYRASNGTLATRDFTVYRTHHGPIVREAGGRWIAVRMMQRPIEALSQSYLRTRARTLAEYRRALALNANSTNNTVYADADGNIAFLLPQFIPRRDDRFDWTKPVDGSDPATEWQGVHSEAETPSVVNPPNGWLANTNNWPYSAAGPNSPRRDRYPRYMDTEGENPRGVHATMLLAGRRDFTMQRLIDVGFDPYLPAFARLVPRLVAAWDSAPARSALKERLAEPIASLRGWDDRWSAGSVPTTLAVLWGTELWGRSAPAARSAGMSVYDYMATRTTADQSLDALAMVCDQLERDFGSWRTPWGKINRFQRLTGDIEQRYSDAAPSLPVPFVSSAWGSLASFATRRPPGEKRRYGYGGNSFVAVVELGDSVRARAVTAGGESSDPRSPHFTDQAARYISGDLRAVYFYPGELVGHTASVYRLDAVQRR